ncbi:unnamed protein product [Cutaneotrichosporon oleaginosum]
MDEMLPMIPRAPDGAQCGNAYAEEGRSRDEMSDRGRESQQRSMAMTFTPAYLHPPPQHAEPNAPDAIPFHCD